MLLLRPSLRRFIPFQKQKFVRYKTTHIALLPEVLDIKPEENSILNFEHVPNFNELNAEKCFFGIAKLAQKYETGIWSLEEKLNDSKQLKSFENIFGELEELESSFQSAWNITKLLACVKNHEIRKDLHYRIQKRAIVANSQKYKAKIYNACRELKKNTNLTLLQKNVLRRMLTDCHLNGLELDVYNPRDFEDFSRLHKRLGKEKIKYIENVLDGTRQYSDSLYIPETAAEFPVQHLKKMAPENYEKGPWKVSLQPGIYEPFLQYCPSKPQRYNAWLEFNKRAGLSVPSQQCNSILVEDIRSLRHTIAIYLGYPNFASVSLVNRMVGSVENALSLINTLHETASKLQTEEIDSLTKFANENGHKGDFRECDLPYWRRLQKQNIYNVGEFAFMDYFPWEHVWQQLLTFSSELFGLKFEEATSDLSTWHPDVKVYDVYDKDGKHLSYFFVDPYERPGMKENSSKGDSWVFPIKDYSNVKGSKPSASLVFNFEAPTDEIPSLLNLANLETLFEQFGELLKHVLSKAPYAQDSELTRYNWDSTQMCKQFFKQWVYYAPLLRKMGRHYNDGTPLEESSIQNIISSQSHLMSFDLCQELYNSELDIKLYSEKKFWMELIKVLHKKYSPFPLTQFHCKPCWFVPIIVGEDVCIYFCYTWAKMMAVDAFQAFTECDPAEIANVGERFRDAILMQCGELDELAAFRQFRGRDPSHEAFLQILQQSSNQHSN